MEAFNMGNNAYKKGAYELILNAIDEGVYGPGSRLVESELADRFKISRTPVREALQKLETQAMLKRDGRSMIVASLNHNQLAELYIVRAELEGLAASLAAKYATTEEVRVLFDMIVTDRSVQEEPIALARANRRFHTQLHLASHNLYLIKQLETVHRTMALLGKTSLAADGRGENALNEHFEIVSKIEIGDSDGARTALKAHLSHAYEMRLKIDAGEIASLSL